MEKYKPAIIYDFIPWNLTPIYDLGDTRIEDYEAFESGQWVPGNNFRSKGRLILKWNISNNSEDICNVLQSAIDSKIVNHICSGNILIGFQDNGLGTEYRAFIIFNKNPTWGNEFTSSTPPEWLKIK